MTKNRLLDDDPRIIAATEAGARLANERSQKRAWTKEPPNFPDELLKDVVPAGWEAISAAWSMGFRERCEELEEVFNARRNRRAPRLVRVAG